MIHFYFFSGEGHEETDRLKTKITIPRHDDGNYVEKLTAG